MSEIHPAAVRRLVEEFQVDAIEVPVGGGDHPADGCHPAVKILLQACDQVVGQRFHRLFATYTAIIDFCVRLLCNGVNDPDGQAVLGFAGYLQRVENRGVVTSFYGFSRAEIR